MSLFACSGHHGHDSQLKIQADARGNETKEWIFSLHLYYLLTAFSGVHLPSLLPRYNLFIFKHLSSNLRTLQLKGREKNLVDTHLLRYPPVYHLHSISLCHSLCVILLLSIGKTLHLLLSAGTCQDRAVSLLVGILSSASIIRETCNMNHLLSCHHRHMNELADIIYIYHF